MDKEAPRIDEWYCKIDPKADWEFLTLVFRVKDKDKLMEHLKPAMGTFCDQKSAEEIGGQCIVKSLSNLSEYQQYADYVQNVVDCWVAGPLSFDDWKAAGMPETDADQV